MEGKEIKTEITKEHDDKLREIIAKVCRVPIDKIKENSNLVTDLGLDSLKRVELVSLMEEGMEIEADESLITRSFQVSDLRKIIKTHAVTNYPYDLEGIAKFLRDPFNRWLKVALSKYLYFSNIPFLCKSGLPR